MKKNFLTPNEEDSIEKAISDAEKHTAAEIKVVIAERSAPEATVKEKTKEMVENRADREFIIEGLGHTYGHTGILIFISLAERIVEIRGGRVINKKVTQAEWGGYVRTIIEGIKAGNPGQGIVNAIREAGKMLAKEFPIQPGDINEIPNHIIYKD